MNVLVLGGLGFVGKEVVKQLSLQPELTVTIGSRRLPQNITEKNTILKVDSTNIDELKANLPNFDCIINCVTGDGYTIAHGAKILCEAALQTGLPKIIHLSSQSVYGTQTGLLNETTSMQDDIGWYGHAKIEAEHHMQKYVQKGGNVTILRPGCVTSANSPLWNTRFIEWLKNGTLGDLGNQGDGWSNLVDVKDVAQAVIKVCLKKSTGLLILNLSAPDSPRWNQYLIDLAVENNLTPVKRIKKRNLLIRVYVLGISLKIIERILKKMRIKSNLFSAGLPPSLLKLFKQDIKLDSNEAIEKLELEWTPYLDLIRKSKNRTRVIL